MATSHGVERLNSCYPFQDPLCPGIDPSWLQPAQLPLLCLAISSVSFQLRLPAAPHAPFPSWASDLCYFLCVVPHELLKGGYLYPNTCSQNLASWVMRVSSTQETGAWGLNIGGQPHFHRPLKAILGHIVGPCLKTPPPYLFLLHYHKSFFRSLASSYARVH